MRTRIVSALIIALSCAALRSDYSLAEGPRPGSFSRNSRAEAPAATKGVDAPPTDDTALGADLRRQIEIAKKFQLRRGPRFSMIGEVRAESGDTFSVNGELFKISPEANIQGTIQNGSWIEVSGPLVQKSTKVADSVVVFEKASQAAAADASSVANPGPSLNGRRDR